MYETQSEEPLLTGKGIINYTIWSEVYICPNCSKEFSYWDAAVEKDVERTVKKPQCPHCGVFVKRESCSKAMESVYDEQNNEFTMQSKCVPIRISYTAGGKRLTKIPDNDDIKIIKKLNP